MEDREDKDTLGHYRKMSVVVFGEDSAAVAFLDKKIAESPDGEAERVIANENQMVHLLGTIHVSSGKPKEGASEETLE